MHDRFNVWECACTIEVQWMAFKGAHAFGTFMQEGVAKSSCIWRFMDHIYGGKLHGTFHAWFMHFQDDHSSILGTLMPHSAKGDVGSLKSCTFMELWRFFNAKDAWMHQVKHHDGSANSCTIFKHELDFNAICVNMLNTCVNRI